MPGTLIKIDRHTNRYVYWSDICDLPHVHGTRSKVERSMRRDGATAARFARADENGTSAYDSGHCGWDDEYLIVEQRGLLPRERLWAFCEAYFGGPERRAEWLDLLEPFDDCLCAPSCPQRPCPDRAVQRG